MRKTEFKTIVDAGRVLNKKYLVVKIDTEGMPEPEIIINPADNFDEKIAYYNKAYNDDMELISAKEAGKSIRIVRATMMDYLDGLNAWFY